MSSLPEQPLEGDSLLENLIELIRLPRNEQAIRCGCYSTKVNSKGETYREANNKSFYEAVLLAKGIFRKATLENKAQISSSKQFHNLPAELEPYKAKLEATIKPYIKIKTQLTQTTIWWRSKIAGFPYLPKNFDYPKTKSGDYLYLLAQINLAETSPLEGFPQKGILQFYIAKDDSYGCDVYNPKNNEGFRILYFPEPDLNEDNIVTNFDFLPTLWDEEYTIPFYVCPSYNPNRDDCFALSFQLEYAPISFSDYNFEEFIGSEIWNLLEANNYQLYNWYYHQFVVGHKLGGYPHFTQDDPREFINEEEPYILLLQIDSDDSAFEKLYIEWGDGGVCNFWIKESALKKCDFSEILYNWDCS